MTSVLFVCQKLSYTWCHVTPSVCQVQEVTNHCTYLRYSGGVGIGAMKEGIWLVRLLSVLHESPTTCFAMAIREYGVRKGLSVAMLWTVVAGEAGHG